MKEFLRTVNIVWGQVGGPQVPFLGHGDEIKPLIKIVHPLKWNKIIKRNT